MIEENHEKTPVRLVGTEIWTRDLPNASLVRYLGASPLGKVLNFRALLIIYMTTDIQNVQC